MSLVPLGEVAVPVLSHKPADNELPEITYIDLSAVDNRTKSIVRPIVIASVEAPSRARQLIAGGDVLVSTVRPNLNSVAQVPSELHGATASTGFSVLRPLQDRLDGRYLFHWVRTSPFVDDMVRKATGASYPAVSDKLIRASLIPLPPVDEQRRIADILDKADALRAQRRETIAKLESLRQSVFHATFGRPSRNDFGWPVQAIGELLSSAQYGTSSKAQQSGTIPVLRMGNMTYDGQLDLRELKYLDEDSGQTEKYLLRPGDVLFNRTNSVDLVGKTALFDHAGDFSFAGYLIRLQCGSELDPQYLTAFMNVPDTKTKLRAMCKSIVGMANINAKEVQAMSIMVPPLELQQQFSNRVAVVERLKTEYRAQLAQLDNLFLSLQDRAFKGEL